jgi:hypothetical protein
MIKLVSPTPSSGTKGGGGALVGGGMKRNKRRKNELPTSMRVVKYLIFVFSFVFLAIGIKLIVVGSILNVQFKGYMDFEGKTSIATAAIAVIAFGATVTLISFFGCTGSLRESRSMIIIVRNLTSNKTIYFILRSLSWNSGLKVGNE